ncbi:type II toxin-antitoxin system RelE/ParE family toxin [bacterium]|nr:MAG: type II toxin-antitoxin system RelE/ParE family toxin [bacterium]
MEIVYSPQVSKFTDGLSDDLASRLDQMVLLLEERGPMLRMPYSKPLGRGLFELRTVGAIHLRVLYFFYENKAFLARGFIKKRRMLGRHEIDQALVLKRLVAGI